MVLSNTWLPDRTERKDRVNRYLGHPTHHLAKTMEIELDKDDIYSGTAPQMLSRAPYEGCALPLVRQITFTIVLGNGVEAEKSAVAANIGALMQRLRQMAPMAKTFQLNPMRYRVKNHISSDYFAELATQLFQLVRHIEYGHIHTYRGIPGLHLERVHNLVSIEHATDRCTGAFIGLAQQNAPTLESLSMRLPRVCLATGIIQNTNGVYISYPCLRTLCLWGGFRDAKEPLPVFKGAIPFPSLRYLKLLMSYPFGDDIFFRGNVATLECLRMFPQVPTVIMLRRYDVFTPQSHPSLRCVSIECYDNLVPSAFATRTGALQFFLNIGTRASVRHTSMPVLGAELIGEITLHNNYASIQVLSLGRTTLDLWQAIALIKALPLLSELRVSPSDIGTLPEGISLDNLPAYVVSTFAPMGTKFKYWHIDTGVGEDSLKCVLLLALACPNLVYGMSSQFKCKPYCDAMRELLALDMFKPYAQRLQYFRFCSN
ncbi:hypothetical protein GGI13_001370 [Coemansia sp. RSA 455]|nr:hypothetical protein GGI13_001370 [Coemansia sp. RSA 455]